MAKWANDSAMDAMLAWIDDADRLFVCASQPANYTEASSTHMLAQVTLTAGAGNGDYTLGNGDSSGRKLTVAQQADIEVLTTGDATHIALCSNGDTTLRYVTTCTTQTLTDGNTVTVPAWDIEVADPS